MEKRVAKKVEQHTVDFKTAIKNYLSEGNLAVVDKVEGGSDRTSDFLKYVFDYAGVQLLKEDFQKRKRVKNIVPHCERCVARRANGDQCTRRKSDNGPFCGTHAKGTPHGVLSSVDDVPNPTKKIEVWVEEIKGINYYIDSDGNVYKHDDVLNNKSRPAVIAKWEPTADGGCCIPAYGL